MKKKLVVQWEKVCEIEVPEGWVVPDTTDGFTKEEFDSLSSVDAWVIDWREYTPVEAGV